MAQPPPQQDSQATKIVSLLLGSIDLFHDERGNPWATLPINGHYETLSLRTRGFREWISRGYYQQHKSVPGNSAIESALSTLAGEAINNGPMKRVYLRRGEHDGKIYIDLCNSAWQVIEISIAGWQVINNAPIPFTRKRGMLPLPMPESGGSLDELKPFLNLGSDHDWYLTASWLLATFSAGPYPALVLGGEQGTGKSTQTKVLRSLIDPNEAQIRSKPRDERDLMITANNSWILAYDNLSSISDWLSDAFCRLSTGGGWATRELWTNDEETIVNAKRPLILNGITEIVNRGDLMDRSLILNIPCLAERKPEEDFWREFNQAKPKIFGAILDIVAGILANLPLVTLPNPPRMADFAKWMIAAEPMLLWPEGTFLGAYIENRENANTLVIDDSDVATAIVDFIDGTTRIPKGWSGTAKELLERLTTQALGTRKYDRFDKMKPHHLSGELRRLAPNFRAQGFDITFHPPARNPTNGKIEKIISIVDLNVMQQNLHVNTP